MPQKKSTVQLIHAVVSRNYYGSHGGGVIMDVHSQKHSDPQSITAPGSDMQLLCQVNDCAMRYTFQLFTDEKMQQLSRAARSRRTKRMAIGYALMVVGGLSLARSHDLALLQGVSIGLLIAGIVLTIVSLLMLIFGRPEMYSLQPVEEETDDQGLGVRYVTHGVELN